MKGWIEVTKLHELINSIEELPGEMPDDMFKLICLDKDAATNALRIIVKQTKDELKAKIEEATKELGE